MYDKLGIQLHFITLDIENVEYINEEQDVRTYCLDWIDENIPNKEYSLVYYNTTTIEVPDLKYGGTKYIGMSGSWYYGNRVTEFLGANGMSIVSTAWERYVDGWQFDNLPRFTNIIVKELLGYKDSSNLIIVISIITIILLIVCIIIAIILKLRKQKRDDDLRILNTPISDLMNDNLTDKYVDDSEGS